MSEELKILNNYLKDKSLKSTTQREIVLEYFIKTEKHLTVEELHDIIRKKHKNIGQSTVFRNLKLFCEAGLAREVDFGDKKIRYEIKYGHEHHDHLICTKCGKFIEVVDQQIEDLQDKLCGRYNFMPKRHRMEIYGICSDCK